MIERLYAKASGGSINRDFISTLISVMSWKIGLALTLMVCLSLTEGMGLLMLVPLLGLVGLDVQQGTVGKLSQLVSSVFATLGLRPALVSVLGLYLLITAAHALLLRWQTVVSLAVENEFITRLRQRLYQAITNSDWLFFSRSRASDFTHALTTELDRVGTATYGLMSLIVNVIVALAYILLALRLSLVMTGVVFACGASLLLLLKGHIRAARVSGEQITVATSGLYAAAIEHLGGMKTVKSYGAEERNTRIFSALTERVAGIYNRAVRDHANMKLWFDIGSVLILSLILYLSLEVLSVPTAGVLMLLFLFARIIPRLSNIQNHYHSFVSELPAFATVMDTQARCEAAAESASESSEQVDFQHTIRLEQVAFKYEPEGAFAIRDLDLAIPAGKTTAIVGPSGAGKSTLADLILGLVTPTAGRVLIDDVPLIASRIKSWRARIGYVAQDTFLFHETVRANLLWASPGASDAQMREALRLAAAGEFVASLPQGMETVLGDRGVRLSGGERQRLALARALLRKPSLLILDEATSALDSENEKRIQSAIEQLRGRMTILVITHRLSTIRDADIIHLVERGSLVESGDWNGLVAKPGGRFQSFYKAQNRDLEEAFEAR